MTAQDVITAARDTLADDGTRWDDARLIRALNEAQKDFAKNTNLLRGTLLIDVDLYRSLYELPEAVARTIQVYYRDEELLFKARDKMPQGWRLVEGIPDTVVYTEANQGTLKLSPTPNEVSEASITYTGDLYGTLIEFSGTPIEGGYGVTVTEPGSMGVAGTVTYTDNQLLCYCSLYPTPVTEVEDELEFRDEWLKALKHYVCAQILRSDADTQNRGFGSEELQLYGVELQIANSQASSDFVQTEYTTEYRSF